MKFKKNYYSCRDIISFMINGDFDQIHKLFLDFYTNFDTNLKSSINFDIIHKIFLLKNKNFLFIQYIINIDLWQIRKFLVLKK